MSTRFGSSAWDPTRPSHLGAGEQRAGHFNFSRLGANGDDYETKAEEAVSRNNDPAVSKQGVPDEQDPLGRTQSPFYQSSEQDHGANRFDEKPPSKEVALGNDANEVTLVDGRASKQN